MRSWRLVLIAAVAVCVAVLANSWGGAPVETSASLRPAPVPVAGRSGALSSTWFCAAGAAATPEPPRHRLILFNPAGDVVSARLTAYDKDGPTGEQTVEVPAPGPLAVEVSDAFGDGALSVMVESSAPELVVEHRLFAENGADQVACATSSSDEWYFPAQTTLRGATAQLVLFNPFSADASVDVSAAVEDGIRVPGVWQGLVVEAGTTEVIDLGSQIQVRGLFSLAVRSRNGRVIAETTQYLNVEADEEEGRAATHGLRMQLGVAQPQVDWSFAAGFSGPGVVERLVVFNPGRRPASALVQVTPFGAAELPPEPFDLEIPPRRFTVIDVGAESRIPGEGFHTIQVQTDGDTPVVVGRVIDIVGAPEVESSAEAPMRPQLDRGTAIGTGTPVASTLWVATGMVVGGAQESAVFVHNPSTAAVVVSATVLGGPADATALADAVELGPGEAVTVPTGGQELGDENVTVQVEASSPVVVERTVTFMRQDDLALGLAVPLRPRGGLVPVAAG